MHERVKVTLCSPDVDIADHWAALSRRAPANVFMNPAALKAAHATHFAQVRMLLAWLPGAQPERLIGIWALQDAHLTPLWPSFLAAPPYYYAFLSNPVIDPEFMDEVVAAFLDAIEHDHTVPNIVRLRFLDADSRSYSAILKALAARGAHTLTLSQRDRPFATREFGLKRAGSTRKKLRQDWNRLCALGSVEIMNDRSQAAAQVAFETYLAMEAASWKGARGTALLCDEAHATFARGLIGALAAERNASVALLSVDGRPVAAQVLLYCGCVAYTWKTAFDSGFASFSPGTLLIDKVSEQLFASDSIDAIESCSPEGGFMNQLWEGRRATVDLLAELGTGNSLGFAAMAMGERSYRQLRKLRNNLRANGLVPAR
jgi:hypothetical protein